MRYSFYSILVRLKGGIQANLIEALSTLSQFLFHTGSIKRVYINCQLGNPLVTALFLFHTGSIKSESNISEST